MEIENDLGSKLTVPQKLTNPHKLIISTKSELMTSNKDTFLYINTITSRNSLDVRVSYKNIGRALRFLDTLIKALIARGHDVQIKNQSTYAIIEEHEFKILFREKMKKESYKNGSWDSIKYTPTNILSFQLYSYPNKEWKDGKVTLEDQLSKIIAQLELAGNEWKELRLKSKMAEAERLESERAKKEFEMLQQKELSDFKQLLSMSLRWRQTKDLRMFIDAREASENTEGKDLEEVNNWLKWARNKADWYDPFIQREDDLFKNVDKETLSVKETHNSY